MVLTKSEFETLEQSELPLLIKQNYFAALKNYIESLRMLYIHRLSIFDNQDASNEVITQSEMHRFLQDTKKSLSEIKPFYNKLAKSAMTEN
uniref:Uncharacterized protein n=1 Tax=Meloidogyne incognita TaxID=6306 RepID=A0A914LFY1_MELIC